MKGKLRLIFSDSPLLLSFERLAMEFRKKLVFQFVGPSKRSLSFHHSYTDLEFPTNKKTGILLVSQSKKLVWLVQCEQILCSVHTFMQECKNN